MSGENTIPESVLAQAAAAIGGGGNMPRTPEGEKTCKGETCKVLAAGGHENPEVSAAVAMIMNSGQETRQVERGGGRGGRY